MCSSTEVYIAVNYHSLQSFIPWETQCFGPVLVCSYGKSTSSTASEKWRQSLSGRLAIAAFIAVTIRVCMNYQAFTSGV